MTLVVAEGALLEQILDLTHPLWGEGLDRHAYSVWNAGQMRTPWGGRHLQRFALVDDQGQLCASIKRYRFVARVAEREMSLSGIGAVFVPPDRRGRGYARDIVNRVIEGERAAGVEAAALFSDIDPRFYASLGFVSAPLDEATVRVKMKNGAPAMLVRAGDERDLPALVAMHDVRSASARFALRRDRDLLHFALAKKRMLAGLGPIGLRQLEFFVAEEGASAVAYVVLSQNANGWTLEDAGDRDPAGARLGAMLQVLLAREPTQRPPLIRAWWPSTFEVPPQLELIDRTAPRSVFMLRSLNGLELPRDGIFYWRGDQF